MRAVLVVQALLLVGCASTASKQAQVATDGASQRPVDPSACAAADGRLTGWLGESMLLGMTFGGGPAVIESENAAKRRAFNRCMKAQRGEPVP